MYRLVALYSRVVASVFYRHAREGADVPGGPLIVVGNHTNGLVDAALFFAHCPRRLRFLGKHKIFDMPILGALAKAVGAIPVYRRQDRIDTALNEPAFDAVRSALVAGEAIAIFPEGTSKGARASRAPLRELRTGAARMALDAEAASDFALGVRIVPVALAYEARDRFRSRVRVRVGTPIEVRHWRDRARGRASGDERAAVLALTEAIGEALGDTLARSERDSQERVQRSVLSIARAPFALLLGLVCVPPAAIAWLIGHVARPTPDKRVTTMLLAGTVLVPAWLLACVILAFIRLESAEAWMGVGVLLTTCAILFPFREARQPLEAQGPRR